MKFQFNPSQEHQLRAISAIKGLFAGQQRRRVMATSLETDETQLQPAVPIYPNEMTLGDDDLLRNLQEVQESHNASAESPIDPDDKLRQISERFSLDEANGLVAGKSIAFPNFSVEMETGTGKTYVFLRAIRELSREFGFTKFLAVVPTVAVRENILHSLATTDSHLQAECGISCKWDKYDSADLIRVRDFVSSDSTRVLVMTIASFNKVLNVIRRDADELSGDTPLRLIQAARPILILDEPQNMESELSQESLARLNPLFALRFSATHRDAYNQIYRFTPAEAYKHGLVKKIHVASVTADNPDAPLIRLIKTTRDSNDIFKARVALNVHTRAGEIAEKEVSLLPDENLGDKSRLPVYDELYIDEISVKPQSIRLSDGRTLQAGQEVGGAATDILRAQIEITIREHFKRQRKLRGKGVKVLSLFFIDRVDKYNEADGEIRKTFEEIFDQLKNDEPDWKNIPAAAVHKGYFAVTKQGDSEADVKAYELIMKDKESLLTFSDSKDDEETRQKRQVAFIFSHSALREGWDNPNICQVCALRTGGSTMRRRQEVGRGLRLVVNQQGKRIQDDQSNVLTVIAREDFADYARNYQMEIAEEYREMIEGRIGKRLEHLTDEERERLSETYGEGIIPPAPKRLQSETTQATRLIRNQKGEVEFSPEFQALWQRISQKTTYHVEIKDDILVSNIVSRLKNESVKPPKIQVATGRLKVSADDGFAAVQSSGLRAMQKLENTRSLPDIVNLVLRLLKNGNPPLLLTRKTVFDIFCQAADDSALANPTGWAALAARVIREELGELMSDGVEYRRIENQFYEWEQWFMDEEREIASVLVAKLRENSNKAPYDVVECDSAGEQRFAEDLDERDDVKLFLKLPRHFKVPTPVGNYNPDWAVLLTDEDGQDHLYFVAETKGAVASGGSVKWNDLRGGEKQKIRYAARHFGSKQFNKKGALEDVDYQVVKTADQLQKRE